MKPRLLILSDMWGLEGCAWIGQYVELLDPVFSIQLYDSCELGNVDVAEADEEAVHSAFVQSGIDIAARRLLELEPNEVDVLAFSVGGTIAWKAGMTGMRIGHFYAASSTRLRLQTEKPAIPTRLFYGSDDLHQPKASWFEQMELGSPIMVSGAHDFYTSTAAATRICGTILADREKVRPAIGG